MTDNTDTHLEVWAAETAALEPTAWELWCEQTETIFGRTLDGDQLEDGYSLDWFYERWQADDTPAQAASTAQATSDRKQ